MAAKKTGLTVKNGIFRENVGVEGLKKSIRKTGLSMIAVKKL